MGFFSGGGIVIRAYYLYGFICDKSYIFCIKMTHANGINSHALPVIIQYTKATGSQNTTHAPEIITIGMNNIVFRNLLSMFIESLLRK